MTRTVSSHGGVSRWNPSPTPAIWLSPPACAVAEPHRHYTGETRFPLILQNAHRFFVQPPHAAQPDGHRLASVTADGRLVVFDTATLAPQRTFEFLLVGEFSHADSQRSVLYKTHA